MPDEVLGPLETNTNIFPDYVGDCPLNKYFLFKNVSGGAITAGSPACLDHTNLLSSRGVDATVPNANNLALFVGVWLGLPDGGGNIPSNSYGVVQTKGHVASARLLGAAGISAAGKFLTYEAGNTYFNISADSASDLREQASRILSAEAYTTASVASKAIFLK